DARRRRDQIMAGQNHENREMHAKTRKAGGATKEDSENRKSEISNHKFLSKALARGTPPSQPAKTEPLLDVAGPTHRTDQRAHRRVCVSTKLLRPRSQQALDRWIETYCTNARERGTFRAAN